MKNKTHFIAQAALIAALYTVLVLVFGFSSFGPVQLRVAEAMTILPYFTPAAIPGLFIGCLISNLVGGALPLDVIFGSLATLLASFLSYKLRSKKWLVPLPPIIVNTVVVGLLLKYAYGLPDALLVLMFGVFLGQTVAIYGLGMLFLKALEPIKDKVFKYSKF